MSLTTSFNKKFLKENLKKSKGAIIFSIIIIPFITALFLILGYKNSSSAIYLSWSDYSLLNIILMYILPLVYSNILFGFVYKKKSSDFINSMPVSKKTIFVTNTIGGIALITLIQVLTAIVVLGCSLFITNLVISTQVIFDSFIMLLTSYIFIFIVMNLAMTISGTSMTQFIVAVLILFFIPFCTDLLNFLKSMDNFSYLTLTNGSTTYELSKITIFKNYTMPYKLFRYALYSGNIYSLATIVRMIGLSMVYFYIGLKLFIKRKMENCEESFANNRSHLILKTLTLIPILLVTNIIGYNSESVSYVIVVFVLLVIYYVLYDFLVKRKIPFKLSVFSFIATIIVLQFGILGLETFLTKKDSNTLDIADISSISFGETENTAKSLLSYYDNDDSNFFNGDYYFKDEELIEWVFDTLDTAYYWGDSKDYIQINFKTKMGKVYSGGCYLNTEKIDDIYEKIFSDSNYKESIEKKLNKDGDILIGTQRLDSKSYNKINKLIKQIDVEELKDSSLDDFPCVIKKYVYVNHKYELFYIPANYSNELMKEFVDFENSKIEDLFEEYGIIEMVDDIRSFSIYLDGTSTYCSNYSYKMLNFIKNNLDDDFDATKPYAIITGIIYDNNNYENIEFSFFTNKVSEVEEFIATNTSKYNYYQY
jgi:ABC-2 type transport system permease protein